MVNRETLHQQRGEARPGASTERVEDKEALEPSALICQLPDPVQDQVHDLLPDGVVAPGVVVGGVLLAGDQLLGMEQLAVGPSPHLVDNSGLQVHKDSPGNMLPGSGLGEESVETVVSGSDGLVRRHLAIGLDAVLQTVELPAGVANLDAGLADVDTDALTHGEVGKVWRSCCKVISKSH